MTDRLADGREPFWSSDTFNLRFGHGGNGAGAGRWVGAAALKAGTRLRTPTGGDTAIVLSGRAPKDTTGWMWDLTVPGGGDHDFYVIAGVTSVLVHNCGPSDSSAQGGTGETRYGPYSRRAAPQTTEEMNLARTGQLTQLQGSINQHGSFRSIDAHVGELTEGYSGYTFYTAVKPSDPGYIGYVRWVEGTPGVVEISSDRVGIPIEVTGVNVPLL